MCYKLSKSPEKKKKKKAFKQKPSWEVERRQERRVSTVEQGHVEKQNNSIFIAIWEYISVNLVHTRDGVSL